MFPSPAPHPCPLDPRTLAAPELEREITELSACINVATWRLLTLIAELERRGAWAQWGVLSCAHWLNWKCGIELGAAREKVRVARALQALPKIDAALAGGELSYSKARAITRVATPQSEDYLLMIARHGTASHVERLVRAYRSVERAQQTAGALNAFARRSLRWSFDDDGSLLLNARLPAEMGELVLQALRAAVQSQRAEREGTDRDAEGVPAETSMNCATANSHDPAESPAAARHADALCHLAEQYLAHGDGASRQAERYQVVVHVDQSALEIDPTHPSALAPERCHLEHGHALAPETARRLACDAAIVQIDESPFGQPLAIGRRTRSIPPSIRRALASRDRGCRFPGCLNHRWVDAHHIRHWADGGETRMENLALLCRHHHTLLHEGGFTLEQRDDGKLLFFRPDGRYLPEVPKPPLRVPSIDVIVDGIGADVSAETSRSLWDGERMDLDIALAGLMDRNGWRSAWPQAMKESPPIA